MTLNAGLDGDDDLKGELVQWVRKEIGPIASPDLIQFAPGLPKHARAKSCGAFAKNRRRRFLHLGDTSTLADPSVVDDLIDNRQNSS